MRSGQAVTHHPDANPKYPDNEKSLTKIRQAFLSSTSSGYFTTFEQSSTNCPQVELGPSADGVAFASASPPLT